VVLRLWLLVNAPSFFGSVVAHEGDFYSFVESSVVHLLLIGLAGLLVAYREKNSTFVPYKTSPQIEQ
jgi:hypothetical protein